MIFALSFVIVFLIMAAQYESWTLPFSVLLGVPIAVFGAFAALYFRHLDNDVYAQVGLVMLIGLSAKNAILIVDFCEMSTRKLFFFFIVWCPAETAPDPDDRFCFYSGLRAAVVRHGRRCGFHGGCQVPR